MIRFAIPAAAVAAVVVFSVLLVSSPRGYIAGHISCPAQGTIHIAAFGGVDGSGFPSGKRFGGTFIPHEGSYLLRNLPVDVDIYIFATLDADGSGDISTGDYYGNFRGAPLRLTTEGCEGADILMAPFSPGGAETQAPKERVLHRSVPDGVFSGVEHPARRSAPDQVPGESRSFVGSVPDPDSAESDPARLHYRGIRTWEVGEGLSPPGGDPFAPFRRFIPFSALLFLLINALIYLNIFLHFRFRASPGEALPESDTGKYPDNRVPTAGESRPSGSGTLTVVAIAGVFLAAALLRLPALAAESLEHLEATYLLGGTAAPSLFWSFFSRVGIDQGHQPLYHGLLYMWTKIAGSSLAAGRLFSALAGLASLPLLFFFGKRIAGRNEALLAVLLLALAPLHVWYSRDLTPYTLMALLSLANYYFLFSAGESGRSRHLAGYIISGVLLFFVHYFGVGIIVAGFCYIAVNLFESRGNPSRRNRWIRTAVAAALLLAILLSWFPMFAETNRIQQYIHSCERDIKRPATPFEGRAILGLFFGSGPDSAWSLFLLLPVSIAAFYHLYRTRRRLFLLTVPPLLVCAAMNLVYWKMTHLHNKGLASNEIRHSLDMLPYLHIAIAAWIVDMFKARTGGTAGFRQRGAPEGEASGIPASGPVVSLRRIVATGALILIVALNGRWLVSLVNPPVKSDVRGACDYIRNSLRDGDAVAVLPIFFYSHQGIYHLLADEDADFERLMSAPSWHPLPLKPATSIECRGVEKENPADSKTDAEAAESASPGILPANAARREGAGEFFAVLSDFDLPYTDVLSSLFFDRIWIIDIRDRLFGAEVFSSRSAEFVIDWLESGAELLETTEFHNVRVLLFEGPVTGAGRPAWRNGVFNLVPGKDDYPFIKGVWPSTVFEFRGRFLISGTTVAVPPPSTSPSSRTGRMELRLTGASSSLNPQELEVFLPGETDPIGSCTFAAGASQTCSFTTPGERVRRTSGSAETARTDKSDRMFIYLDSEMEYNSEAERPLGVRLTGLTLRFHPAGYDTEND